MTHTVKIKVYCPTYEGLKQFKDRLHAKVPIKLGFINKSVGGYSATCNFTFPDKPTIQLPPKNTAP